MDAASNDKVRIFDTTLRDGEQAPGCSMTLTEKLRIAKALAELRVDVIEAGFAAASPGDFDAVNAIASDIQGPVICSLARCNPEDIERAADAVAPANKKRIHVFVATSEIHRTHKLNMAKDEIIRSAVGAIKLARKYTDDVEFSPEDASRTEAGYLADVVTAAIEAGATTINIPDTVGYTVPGEFYELFRQLKEQVPGVDDIVLSVHCHDDLGMAVANSLAAVRAGARQVECTINGIGERAGNCSLEEIVMALKTRDEYYKTDSGVDTTRLYPTARLVSTITGMQIPRNKAIVGENAFAHEAGIHQHGMMKHHSTYEIMRPESIGVSKSNLVLGKHSGRHAFRERVENLGFHPDEFELNRAFQEFKSLADRKKDMFDADIEAIMMNSGSSAAGPWFVDSLTINTKTGQEAQATLRLTHENGETVEKSNQGDGPVAAAFTALEDITGVGMTLINFELHSVSMGEDAQGEVSVTVDYNDAQYRGRGVSTDIVESGVRAYLEVINRVIRRNSDGVSPGPGSDRRRANV